MKTNSTRIYKDDYEQIKNWSVCKGNSIAETVHALVSMAKSVQYQRQYERSLDKCSKLNGSDNK